LHPNAKESKLRAAKGGHTGRPRKALPDREILRLYKDGQSEAQLARQFGTSRGSIHRRLVSMGITTRDAVEATALRTRKTFQVTEAFLELVDGLLLGDAWIEVDGTSEGRLGLEQTVRHEPWLDSVEQEFFRIGISVSRGYRKPRVGLLHGRTVKSKRSATLRTRKYRPFTEQRVRWYPDGGKHVPSDVRLSPRALAHWYWGDGATVNEGYGMLFHTDGFAEEDVARLRSRIKTLYGWATTQRERRPGQFTIGIYRQRDRAQLAALIGPYCPPCFTGKIDIKPRAPSKISEVEHELRSLRAQGWTQNRLSAHFQMSPGWGGWACRKFRI